MWWVEINRRNGRQVPSAHSSPTGDGDTGTENGTCWTTPVTKTLLGCREGLGPAGVPEHLEGRSGVHKQLCP